MDVLSLYLHIPFCRHRCAYCDFNTYAGMENLIADYVTALIAELGCAAAGLPPNARVHTLFLGGGTPSLLPLSEVSRLLSAVRDGFPLTSGAEITLEANPGTLSREYLRGLRSLGVNRLSLGMQSASPEDLRILERGHDFFDVVQAVKWARQAGFGNLNLDLIFGLPYQSLASWQRTLELALDLRPDHLSLYHLTLEHGTPMNSWVQRGLLPAADSDLAAEMYEWAMARLEKAGFEQYEISNWARRSADGRLLACQHNLQYWHNLPYLGLGAGAHGFAAGCRTVNVRGPQAYINRCRNGAARPFPRTPATVHLTPIDRATEMAETMMMGLRLVQEGVPDRAFRQRFGVSIEAAFPREIHELRTQGLVEWSQGRLRLTARGKMFGNRVFMRFV